MLGNAVIERLNLEFLGHPVLGPHLRRAHERGQLLVPGEPVPDGIPICNILNRDLHPRVMSLRPQDTNRIHIRIGREEVVIPHAGKSASLLHSPNVPEMTKVTYRREPAPGDTLYIYTPEMLRKIGLVALAAPLLERPLHLRLIPLEGYDEQGDIPARVRQAFVNMLRENKQVRCIHHT